MLFRSTGLGKTELVAKVADISRQGDYLIFHIDTLEPVRWRIRAGFSIRDLGTVIKLMINPKVLAFALLPTHWFKKAEHPGDF
jgi:nucleoside-triphosphatase THEP1